MIQFDERLFSKKELVFIKALADFFTPISKKGKIVPRLDGGWKAIRVECENTESKELLVVQVIISEEHNSVNLTNIVTPFQIRGQSLSKQIIDVLLKTSEEVGLDLFITGIVNEAWAAGLIRNGGTPWPNGSILIEPENWIYSNNNI